MTKPILYSGTKNASSWAMRAWLALRAAGYEFREEVIDIRRPQRYANLARVGELSRGGNALSFDAQLFISSFNHAMNTSRRARFAELASKTRYRFTDKGCLI